jgi:hypothetical protein
VETKGSNEVFSFVLYRFRLSNNKPQFCPYQHSIMYKQTPRIDKVFQTIMTPFHSTLLLHERSVHFTLLLRVSILRRNRHNNTSLTRDFTDIQNNFVYTLNVKKKLSYWGDDDGDTHKMVEALYPTMYIFLLKNVANRTNTCTK